MPDTIHDPFRVTFGTGAPPPSLERFGPSTLVEVGAQKFIFDAGRGAMQRLHQLGYSILRYHRDVFNAPSFRSRGRVSRSLADGLDRPAVGQTEHAARCLGSAGNQADDGAFAAGFRRRLARPQPKLSARRCKVKSSRNQGRRGIRSGRDRSERLRGRSWRRRIAGVWLSNRLSKSRRRAVRRHDVQRKPDRAFARSRPIGT